MKRKTILCVTLMLLICAGLLCGCLKKEPLEESPVEAETEKKSQEEQFDLLLDELFEEIVTSDSISLNYFLADPSAFGIAYPTPTYGEVTSPETIIRDRQENHDLYADLMGFQYDKLRPDQQVVYDILLYNLDLYELLDSADDYSYYLGAIRPLNGLQVQLPIILAEFNFYTADDIEIYLDLLQDTGRYFDELIAFERERSAKGFFLSDANSDKVIEHCESFLEDPENCFMIIVFNDRIDQYESLSADQREQLKQRNRELVLGNVLPAYETLLDAIRELRGLGANPGGLADLPDGIMFAHAYMQYHTGTNKTPEQVDDILANLMDETLTTIRDIFDSNPRLSDRYFSDSLGKMHDDTSENYLAALESAITRDFPVIGSTRYVVRNVHDSMQDHVSPAFFLTPALDRYDDNVIYINPPSITDNLSLFTTLAHEGYPGHLYQTVYYLQQHPHPLRTVLGDWGYTEGWATYAEFHSYLYAGLEKAEARLMQYSNLFDLLFITRIDLGVNALGWDTNKVASFCRQLGISDYDVAEDLYNTVTGNPLLYLPYCLGYIEIVTLLGEAQAALGSDFSLPEFHRFFLDFGPAPFPVIRTHMQNWIESQLSDRIAA